MRGRKPETIALSDAEQNKPERAVGISGWPSKDESDPDREKQKTTAHDRKK